MRFLNFITAVAFAYVRGEHLGGNFFEKKSPHRSPFPLHVKNNGRS